MSKMSWWKAIGWKRNSRPWKLTLEPHHHPFEIQKIIKNQTSNDFLGFLAVFLMFGGESYHGKFPLSLGLLRLCIYQLLGFNEYDPLSRALRGGEGGGRTVVHPQSYGKSQWLSKRLKLDGGFKYFLNPYFGEDSHFDSYFSNGLKPPTSKLFWGLPSW